MLLIVDDWLWKVDGSRFVVDGGTKTIESEKAYK